MKIGVPKEIKDQEFRVGLTPAAAQYLILKGHEVYLETHAGVGSGFTDQQYAELGVQIVPEPAAIWAQDLVVKVKEPLAAEYPLLRKELLLFTYLHLAANRTLTEALIASGADCVAYETVQLPNGQLPLLTPMSIIAGRLSVQFGARFLEKQQGGRGVLLGGIPGVRPAHVVILGGGTVGTEAARIAVGLGARVQILDVSIDRLNYLETIFGSRVEYLYSSARTISEIVPTADLLVGAVLVTGDRAPTLVTRQQVAQMRPGSVIVDVAVDQGGCVETLHPTSHSAPVYVEEGVVHYGVPNMPGAVPWTATQALTNVTLPYVAQLAQGGLGALAHNPALAQGLNVYKGKICHPIVSRVFPDLA